MENLAATALHGILFDRCARCGESLCDCRACRQGRAGERVCDACELARAEYFASLAA